MLDAYSRRHEGQKIYLRQQAAQRWVGWRDQVLQGQRPHAGHTEQLTACDAQLRVVSVSAGSAKDPRTCSREGLELKLSFPGARSNHRRLDLLRHEIFRLPDGPLDSGRSKPAKHSKMGRSQALIPPLPLKWERIARLTTTG